MTFIVQNNITGEESRINLDSLSELERLYKEVSSKHIGVFFTMCLDFDSDDSNDHDGMITFESYKE